MHKALGLVAGGLIALAVATDVHAETIYGVHLVSPDGSTADVSIHRSLNPLPGSDTWTASDPADFGNAGGHVSSWGQGNAYLSGTAGVQSIELDGFTAKTKAGDTGTGSKNYDEGSFPMGTLSWTCTNVK